MFGNEFEYSMREFLEMGGEFQFLDQITIAKICKGDTTEFATAVCAKHDRHIPAVGMAIALQHFVEGKTVHIPTNMPLL